MEQVLIWKGKHSDAIYDASTPQKLAEASLAVLDLWLNAYQYVYKPDDPVSEGYLAAPYHEEWRKTVELARRELMSEPPDATADMRELVADHNKKVEQARERVHRATQQYQRELDEYVTAKQLVDEWDTSIVAPEPWEDSQGRKRQKAPFPKAWDFLQSMSSFGSEYQEVELYTLAVPERPTKDDAEDAAETA